MDKAQEKAAVRRAQKFIDTFDEVLGTEGLEREEVLQGEAIDVARKALAFAERRELNFDDITEETLTRDVQRVSLALEGSSLARISNYFESKSGLTRPQLLQSIEHIGAVAAREYIKSLSASQQETEHLVTEHVSLRESVQVLLDAGNVSNNEAVGLLVLFEEVSLEEKPEELIKRVRHEAQISLARRIERAKYDHFPLLGKIAGRERDGVIARTLDEIVADEKKRVNDAEVVEAQVRRAMANELTNLYSPRTRYEHSSVDPS